MSREINPHIAPDVIWHQLDENAIVVSPKVGKVRVFNGTGTVIWQMLVENKTLDAIRAQLIQTYDVALERADADLRSFVTELITNGLLIR